MTKVNKEFKAKKGDKGDQGDAGRGILKTEIIDGCLWITYTDDPENPVNIGKVSSDDTDNTGSTDDYGLDFYPLPDGTYAVGAGNSLYIDKISIPATYNGKAVTQIIQDGFSNSPNLKEISIPDSVVNIGESAFSTCRNLSTISIGNNVTTIGRSAFSGCTSLKNVVLPESLESLGGSTFAGAGITNMKIPATVTEIGPSEFYNCKDLISVTIGEGVKTINDSAFYGCSSLDSVAINGNLTTIESKAFQGCSNLKNINIPNSVTSIDRSAFINCSNLSYNEYKNGKYIGNSENLYMVLIGIVNTQLTTLSLSPSTKFIIRMREDIPSLPISDSMHSVEEIIIEDGMTNISDKLFSDLYNLKSVSIPNSVTNIGSNAFEYSGLTSITIGNSVTNIGAEAFFYCTSITSVTIPDSVTNIGSYAFSVCNSLTSINYRGTEEQWNAISKTDAQIPTSCEINYNYTGE